MSSRPRWRKSASPPRLLLTADRGPAALAAVRALRAAGYEPWLAVWQARTYAARSRAKAGLVTVPDPSGDSEAFVRALADAAGRLAVAAVLPDSENSLVALAGREGVFPRGVLLGAPARETVERATDKSILSELASMAGLATPPTLVVHREEVEGRARALSFPAVVKPLRSLVSTASGTRYVDSRCVVSFADLLTAFDALPDGQGIVQPYLAGSLTAVCGVSWYGELVCAMHQAALRTWPPGCGISAYATTVPPDPELERAAGRLLGAIGWSGIFQLQFLETDAGRYLIDLNPRIYGSLGLAIGAGLNLPGIWADLLLGRQPRVSRYRVGVRWRVEEHDLRALRAWFVQGRRWQVLHAALPRRRTVHAVFSIRDPAPALTSLANLRAALRRRAAS